MPFFQDVDSKLTLTRVATAPALVAEVAKLTHSKLEVSPLLSNEILMVSVEGAQVTDVLAKLAVAATAVWQPMEGGYRLVPDVAARSIEASSERARRLQTITDGIKKRQAAQAKQAVGGKAADEEAMPDMGAMFGGGGGTDAFLPMLDLAALANMEPGDRIVFATNANSAQRPLRGNPSQLVATWIAAHNKAAKSMGASMSEVPDEMAGFMKGPIGDRMRRMSQPVTAAPTKIIIVASRGANALFSMGGGLDVRLEIRAYGANGAVLVEQSGSLDANMMEMFAAMAAGQKPSAAMAKATPIVYSDDAKALMALGGENPMMGGGIGRGLKMTASLREKMFSPDHFDPLAIVPGEGLVALSKARRKSLVACIPDAAYPGLLNDAAPKTIEEVEESLKTGTMRMVPDASFLVIRASEPETARRARLDRTALAKLMAAVADHETPNLDELAEFASKSVPPARNDVTMSFLSKFVPTAMGSMSGMVSWDALRLYAALSPAQRQSLAAGAKLPFANLSAAAQGSLRAMLYGAGDNLVVERPGVSSEPDIFSMGIKMMMGGGGIDARDEPTEIAPRGLPGDGYLQAAVSSDAVIRPTTDEGPVYYTIGMDELALFKMISSSGLPGGASDAMALPDAGRLGTRTTWNLRGYVAPGAFVGSALNDDRTPKDGARVSLSNLPAELQAKLAQKTEKMKKSPLGSIISMGATFGKPQVRP